MSASHSINIPDLNIAGYPVDVAVVLPVKRKEHIIQVRDLLEPPPIFIKTYDSQKVYDLIYPLIRQGEDVVLDFTDVDVPGTAGLSIAIGQLYDVLPEEVIQRHLTTRGLEPLDQALLLDVCDNAKKYYSNRELYDRIWEEILSEDE